MPTTILDQVARTETEIARAGELLEVHRARVVVVEEEKERVQGYLWALIEGGRIPNSPLGEGDIRLWVSEGGSEIVEKSFLWRLEWSQDDPDRNVQVRACFCAGAYVLGMTSAVMVYLTQRILAWQARGSWQARGEWL